MKFRLMILALCLPAVIFAGRSKDDNAKYSAKKRFGKGDFHSRISYIATAPDNTLYALESSGIIHKYDASTKEIGKFDTGMKSTQALAISEAGEVYVFSTSTRKEEREYNNRKYKVDVPSGVEYKVFDKNDKELRSKKLDNVMSAQAAHLIGGKLVIADNGKRVIRILDPESGKETASISGLRLCCGIFDFCEGPDNTIAVSNLGAFQVQCYNLKGKKVFAFGKRGKGIDDFHGCCNPVSAGYLSDGRILTVEKSPTRIKIYNAKGRQATEVQNVEELVQGCSYIPVAINSNDEVFLAANGSSGTYLVKCEK